MDEEQKRAPLYEAMECYRKDGAVGYHTPGHKQGKGAPAILREMITEKGLQMEVSLMAELDDLHAPEGCIAKAQQLAARLYQADASYFSINGTSGAIQAMILTAVTAGDTILIPRNAHRSIMSGLILSGAQPVYMQPEIDRQLGIAMGISLETVKASLEQHPEAKAVLVIHPTYYGVVSDLKQIAAYVHQQGKLLLVDEAHGAHLPFSQELPISAIEAGADLVAQSTHKLLASMTQTSMLHASFARVSREKLEKNLSLLQSTSPNYLLMASLDAARRQMAMEGKDLVGRALHLAQKLRQQINEIAGLYCFGKEKCNGKGIFSLDEMKLTVNFRGLGLSGPEAEQILRHRYKIQAELADQYNVLFIFSLADTEKEAEFLLHALQSMAVQRKSPQIFPQEIELPPVPPQKMLPRSAFFAETETCLFKESIGQVSAEAIVFYPPGIPILCPGEGITREIIDYACRMKKLGLKVTGPADTTLNTIKVVK